MDDLSADQDAIDAKLEGDIQAAKHEMLTSPTRVGQQLWCDELKRLHALRSPQQVARMEREQGLR